MKTGISTFIYGHYSIEEAIQNISIAGYDSVEIWGGRPHAYRNDLREHEIRNIRNLIDDLGLQIISFDPAQFGYPSSLCSPIKNIRMDSVRYIKDSIETAVRLGASIISVFPGHTLNNQDLDDGWERLADSLDRICEFAGHYNILVAIKPGNKYQTDLINTTIQAVDMIDQLGFDNLGVLFDCGNAFIAGEDTASAIENLGDRLIAVHVNDNDGKTDQKHIPGHGQFDFRSLIHALRLTLYEGIISADLGWDYTNNPDPAAIETQEYLYNLINR
jgi:sugar phosphate isomerase/epimerase